MTQQFEWISVNDSMPEEHKEVLVAVQYSEVPLQAYWSGKEWIGSRFVRDCMADGDCRDARFADWLQQLIYAWTELPKLPPMILTIDRDKNKKLTIQL